MSATPGPLIRPSPSVVDRLESMIGGEHRVHVAGQQDLRRRLRAHREMEVAPALDRADRAVGQDRLDGIGVKQVERAGKRREGVGELGRRRWRGRRDCPSRC